MYACMHFSCKYIYIPAELYIAESENRFSTENENENENFAFECQKKLFFISLVRYTMQVRENFQRKIDHFIAKKKNYIIAKLILCIKKFYMILCN
jgi:hypothetical protein